MTGHRFVRPGQVAADRPARDACMQCGRTEAQHTVGGLGLDVRILARELAEWSHRDASTAPPEVREAANTAMRAIDRMLAELHELRSQLLSQMRQYDDATAARARREAGQ